MPTRRAGPATGQLRLGVGHRSLFALLATIALGSVATSVPSEAATSTASGRLEVFLHPSGGTWTSHGLHGVHAGVGTPSVAAASGGRLVVVTTDAAGNVGVAEGIPDGAFTSVNLSVVATAPTAAGQPRVAVQPTGAVSVWYRTQTGDLEVVSRTHDAAPWVVDDVTSETLGPLLAGDPVPIETRAGQLVAFAVTSAGSVAEFVAPTTPTSPWTTVDPTGGLPVQELSGTLDVFRAPGAPAATVIVATTSWGGVLELSNELAGARPAVGPWHESDLTALGAPGAAGPLAMVDSGTPVGAYVSWSGDLVSLTLTSGLPGGFSVRDLTRTEDAESAPRTAPTVLTGLGGVSIAYRTATGDLAVVPASGSGQVSDVSFQRSTAELVASDAAAASVGGVVAVVALDAGPIARTALQRRIALTAASYDQQHRGIQTTPKDTDCNPFTAAFGRGSSWGCKPGTAAEAWCSDFSQWVWQTSGVHTSGITGWSASFVIWGAAHHRVQFGTHFHAEVGDAIVWGTRSPLYGTHVGIIVAVVGQQIDVVSGNSGGDLPGYEEGVWRSGLFTGSTSTVSGYHVLGVVTP